MGVFLWSKYKSAFSLKIYTWSLGPANGPRAGVVPLTFSLRGGHCGLQKTTQNFWTNLIGRPEDRRSDPAVFWTPKVLLSSTSSQVYSTVSSGREFWLDSSGRRSKTPDRVGWNQGHLFGDSYLVQFCQVNWSLIAQLILVHSTPFVKNKVAGKRQDKYCSETHISFSFVQSIGAS